MNHLRHINIIFYISKYLTRGNIFFLSLSFGLFLFVLISGLADVFNGLPISKWFNVVWETIKGTSVSEIAKVTDTEKLLTETAKKVTVQDAIPVAQQVLPTVGTILLALLDEICGIVLLTSAFLLRIFYQYIGKASLLPWVTLTFSGVPVLLEYI